jgi:hypothetical protein
MILREKIASFLRGKVKRPYCDDCLHLEVGADIIDVSRETESMKDL